VKGIPLLPRVALEERARSLVFRMTETSRTSPCLDGHRLRGLAIAPSERRSSYDLEGDSGRSHSRPAGLMSSTRHCPARSNRGRPA